MRRLPLAFLLVAAVLVAACKPTQTGGFVVTTQGPAAERRRRRVRRVGEPGAWRGVRGAGDHQLGAGRSATTASCSRSSTPPPRRPWARRTGRRPSRSSRRARPTRAARYRPPSCGRSRARGASTSRTPPSPRRATGRRSSSRSPRAGRRRPSEIPFTVVLKSTVISVGDHAPASKTPTLSDVGGDVRQISTDTKPDPSFYQLSVDQALARHTPFILVFATPAFCKSAQCGPTLDRVKAAKASAPASVAFIHVEPYILKYADGSLQPVLDAQGNFQPIQSVTELGHPVRALDLRGGPQRHRAGLVRGRGQRRGAERGDHEDRRVLAGGTWRRAGADRRAAVVGARPGQTRAVCRFSRGHPRAARAGLDGGLAGRAPRAGGGAGLVGRQLERPQRAQRVDAARRPAR